MKNVMIVFFLNALRVLMPYVKVSYTQLTCTSILCNSSAMLLNCSINYIDATNLCDV